MQSSTAFTHRLQVAPHFTYPEGMDGWVNPPTPGVEPVPLAWEAMTLIAWPYWQTH